MLNRIIIKYIKLLLLIIALFLITTNCKVTDENILRITTVTPNTIYSFLPVNISINGEGFNTSSLIIIDDIEMNTEFISSNELKCKLIKSLYELPVNSKSKSLNVKIKNDDGDISNIVNITLKHNQSASSALAIMNGNGFSSRNILNFFIDNAPKLFLIILDTLQSDSSYSYRLIRSDDNGKTWNMINSFPLLNKYFFLKNKIYGWKYSNGNVNFYQSDTNGEEWKIIGNFTIPQPTNNSLKLETLNINNTSKGVIYLIYGFGDSKNLILSTNYSDNFGKDWVEKGKYNFDVSYIEGYSFDRLLINNTGSLRLIYSYPYGRYGSGGGLISTDYGKSYENSYYCYGIEGGIYILSDNNKIFYRSRSMYVPYMYKDIFGVAENIGVDSPKISFYLEDLFTDYTDGNTGMTMDNNDFLYLYWNNYISKSVDEGETWSSPDIFLNSTISIESSLIKFSADNIMYIAIIDESKNLYFASSL